MNLPFILNFEQRQRDFYNINDIPILIEHFNHSGYGPFGVLKMIPSDYERLKKDIRYINILNTNIINRNTDLFFISDMRDRLIEIRDRLEEEI